jgi:Ca2+-binding EF-hand superfamily protein
VLARRKKVGGVPRRDVLAFRREMCARIDRDGSGDISMPEFLLEVESGASGVQHMRRTLEAMFRSADTNGDGVLSLYEFARVMMPRASPRQLNEILAFVTYDGPAVDTQARKKVYSAETVAQLRSLFELYDTDGSGAIDREEMRAALRAVVSTFYAPPTSSDEPLSAEVAAAAQQREDAFFATMDKSGDGEVDFAEFVALMSPFFE